MVNNYETYHNCLYTNLKLVEDAYLDVILQNFVCNKRKGGKLYPIA